MGIAGDAMVLRTDLSFPVAGFTNQHAFASGTIADRAWLVRAT